jgi:glycosyltransferase involved in cell wall biosynthesis
LPSFSIILPVRNGGDYVKECISSIFSQSVDDFDLIILDNSSTDGTMEWIKNLDNPRIRIYPSSKSLSIEENWRRVLDVPKNEFMTLIGHDDLLGPNYIESMKSLIKQHPEASLFFSHFSYINNKGAIIKDCQKMDSIEPISTFLMKFLTGAIDLMGTGFMMRSVDYDKIGGIPMYPNLLYADFELWLNLAKRSYMAVSSENCFSFRIHQSMTKSSADVSYQIAFDQFVGFLSSLESDPSLRDVIVEHGGKFLDFYCKGLTHRLLRTPKKRRGELTVASIINKFKIYASSLGVKSFTADKMVSVRLGKFIDSNPITRNTFLLLKRVYAKPIMR